MFFHIFCFSHGSDRVGIWNFPLNVEGNTVFTNGLTQKDVDSRRNIKTKIREQLFRFFFDFFINRNIQSCLRISTSFGSC